ncbi:cytosine-specific methyltransferase [Kurthia zopfii]|uniref:Cytosine-specific methyltransferase n=1 Tax=Kurthia zopfii TaxID=1650 RepID=A0A8B4QC64_9BACL|nr:DNA (cytosine-5-)-methyltransferase [Kurthia zopfii]PWI21112.1 DNA (cytosine-5-)-methyltransferase [Kurthia zopfii]TDR32484.1 DNA (cytosine-5)-methyltransferase 1 [Kurthia zopfii]GEK32266.1 cytosine-specific methyltransferase [Kurthia zopfii]STX10363.1 Modification methylase HhaI [Kurthia zopfii]
MEKTMNVVELFAGVGGFRLGLEKANKELFKTVWANQWEPSKKVQHAYECYSSNFTEGIASNENITLVPDSTFQNLNIDLLVGGFPCQDYSVARSLSKEEGIKGKKGVLFWDIKRIIENSHPKYVLLENVDRLLKSPSKQRGRDFAVMLATFRDLQYTVEWRVINAAEYGQAQRRRRVFIFAYKDNLDYSTEQQQFSMDQVLYEKGFFAETFPVEHEPYKNRRATVTLPSDIVDISDEFSFEFHHAGIMRNGEVHTIHTIPNSKPAITLGEILENEVDEKYYLTEAQIEKFAYLRGPKKIERTSADGHKYVFSEGGMSPVDDLNLPGRTMLTSEASVNRSTHVVEVDGRKRFLTPVECERLNSFPDNWTANIPERMRYFTMGNALVVNLIRDMAKTIEKIEAREHVSKTQLEFDLIK